MKIFESFNQKKKVDEEMGVEKKSGKAGKILTSVLAVSMAAGLNANAQEAGTQKGQDPQKPEKGYAKTKTPEQARKEAMAAFGESLTPEHFTEYKTSINEPPKMNKPKEQPVYTPDENKNKNENENFAESLADSTNWKEYEVQGPENPPIGEKPENQPGSGKKSNEEKSRTNSGLGYYIEDKANNFDEYQQKINDKFDKFKKEHDPSSEQSGTGKKRVPTIHFTSTQSPEWTFNKNTESFQGVQTQKFENIRDLRNFMKDKGYDQVLSSYPFDLELMSIMKNVSENDLTVVTAEGKYTNTSVAQAALGEKLRIVEMQSGLKNFTGDRSFGGTHLFYKETKDGKFFILFGLCTK